MSRNPRKRRLLAAGVIVVRIREPICQIPKFNDNRARDDDHQTGTTHAPGWPPITRIINSRRWAVTPALEAVGILVEWGIREAGTGRRIIRISRKAVEVRSRDDRDDL